MSYYASIIHSTLRLPKENFEEAYRRMCELNNYDELKNGGRWTRIKGKPIRQGAWFARMDENYPDTLDTAEQILNQLGFNTTTNDDGDVLIDDFEEQCGQEDLFLKTICDLLDGEIQWAGEDGTVWGYLYGGEKPIAGKMRMDYE